MTNWNGTILGPPHVWPFILGSIVSKADIIVERA